MDTLPICLPPGADLRRALEAVLAEQGGEAAFLIAGIGSLSVAQLRFAGANDVLVVHGDTEMLTSSGSIAPRASHLPATLARADGQVLGGHVGYGCSVRTTAELLLAWLPQWQFSRQPDVSTCFDELVVRRRPGSDSR